MTIKVKDLSVQYENKIIFYNTELEIPNNKLTMLIGANGTGKTTLFKIITKNIEIKNINIYNDFKKIFLLPQKITYPTGLTLYEYVTSFFYSNSLKWFITEEEKQQTEKVLEILELSDRKNILIDNLSSGELQKANIATALLSKSDCLFLDEPTSNMDLINQIKILEILKKLKNEDITCVMIIHDLNAAAMYGDYFIGINKDKKIISLEKSEFFTEKNLEDIFGIKIKVVKNNDNVTVQFLN